MESNKKLPDLHQAVISENELDKQEFWLNQRKGKFTASEFVRLMGYENKPDFPDGAKTYVIEKVIDLCTNQLQSDTKFSNSAIDWGKNTEVEAVEMFIKKMNLKVAFFGDNQNFIEKSKDVGCTPDGLIDISAGIEVKCPDSKTHFNYITSLNLENFKKECTKYYWQIQGSMYITNRIFWYFISYDPRFINVEKRLFILKIERNQNDIDKLENRLTSAIQLKNKLLKSCI